MSNEPQGEAIKDRPQPSTTGAVRDSRFREPGVVAGTNPLANDESDDEDIPLDQAPTPQMKELKEALPEENSDNEVDSDEDFELDLPPPVPVPTTSSLMASPLLKSLQHKVFKQGWLSKSSIKDANGTKKFMGRSVDVWKKRWVVLMLDDVSYYKTEEDYKAGTKLGNVQLGVGFDVVSESECVLCVTSGGRSLSLKASTPELKNQWVTAFDYLRQLQVDFSAEATQTVGKRMERFQTILEAKPAAVVEQVVEQFKQGWLFKQGGTASKGRLGLGRTSWKKRWVVLNSNGLSYYDTEDAFKKGEKEITFIAVDRAFDFKAEDKEKDKLDTSFSLVSSGRTLPLRAETKEQREEWFVAMKALQAHREKFTSDKPVAQGTLSDLQPVPQLADDKFVDKNSFREGYLLKDGAGRGMSKTRYFVLLPGELRYYKHPKDPKPLGTILLDNKSVLQPSKEAAHCFFVVPVPNGRQYVLTAKDSQDEINWLDAFRRSQPSMNILRKADDAPVFEAQEFKKSTRSIKEGFMLKQGHINKSWKRRYFVLEPTLLVYYKCQTDKEAKGQVALGAEGDFVTAETDVRLTITSGPRQTKTVLTCESPVECLAWLNALQTIKKLTVHPHLNLTPMKRSKSSGNMENTQDSLEPVRAAEIDTPSSSPATARADSRADSAEQQGAAN